MQFCVFLVIIDFIIYLESLQGKFQGTKTSS